eukprot:Filipodium_phascolosomae@DN1413_c0_g1_i2.p1
MSGETKESTCIRYDVMEKLIGNIAFNPVSGLTGCLMEHMCKPSLPGRALVELLMKEVLLLSKEIGYELKDNINGKLDHCLTQVPKFKTSMLQDVEANRLFEFEPIVGATLEIAKTFGVTLPTISVMYQLLWVKDQVMREL